MQICPNCFQTMTWYMTYNNGTPYSGYHCNNCGYDTVNYLHGVTTDKTMQTDQLQPPILTKVCDVSEDSINRIADAVVRKLEERNE